MALVAKHHNASRVYLAFLYGQLVDLVVELDEWSHKVFRERGEHGCETSREQ